MALNKTLKIKSVFEVILFSSVTPLAANRLCLAFNKLNRAIIRL